MLQILVNKTPLILDPKTKIRLEMNTSYFDVDEIKGDVVWHFDVPAQGNEETFEYANFIIVRNKKRAYDCIIKLHEIPIGRGKMVISKSTKKTFRVTVSLNSFGVDFDGVSLKDAPYQEETIGGTPHDEANVLQHATDVNSGSIERDYRFPMIYAPLFYGEDTTFYNLAGEHPEFNPDYLRFLNHWQSGAFLTNDIDTIMVNRQSMVPFPMLIPTIKKALTLKDYTLSGALADNTALNNLLVFNNVSLDDFLTNWFCLATSDIYMHWFTPYQYHVVPLELEVKDEYDCFLNDTYLVREAGAYNVNTVVMACGPQVRVIHDVVYVGAAKGRVAIFKNDVAIREVSFDEPYQKAYPPETVIGIQTDCEVGDTINVRVIYDEAPNGCGIVMGRKSYLQVYKQITTPGKNVHLNRFNLVDCLPDIKLTTLVNSLRNSFFLSVFFDDENKVVYTESLKDILANAYVVDVSNHMIEDSSEVTPVDDNNVRLDWEHNEDLNDVEASKLLSNTYFSDLVAQYQKAYSLLTGCNAVYVYDTPEGESDPVWSFYRQNFKGYGLEDSSLKPSIKFCPMPTQEVDSKIYPYTTKKGVSEKIPDSNESIGIQLLHWYGVLDIPYASPLATREGGEVLGPVSIDFNGANGIVANSGSEWLSFLAQSEEFRVLLTNIDIWKLLEIQSLFLPKKKADHPRWVLADNVKALPRQATAEIDISGKITAFEMKLVKSAQ